MAGVEKTAMSEAQEAKGMMRVTVGGRTGQRQERDVCRGSAGVAGSSLWACFDPDEGGVTQETVKVEVRWKVVEFKSPCTKQKVGSSSGNWRGCNPGQLDRWDQFFGSDERVAAGKRAVAAKKQGQAPDKNHTHGPHDVPYLI